MSEISIHIENLVIHGSSQMNQAQLSAAIQQAITQLIHKQGVPVRLRQSTHIPTIQGGQIPPPKQAESVGQQIGQAVYKGLNR